MVDSNAPKNTLMGVQHNINCSQQSVNTFWQSALISNDWLSVTFQTKKIATIIIKIDSKFWWHV